MNWSDLARQQDTRNAELAQLIAANDARAADAERQREREAQGLLTGDQRAARRELAKAIMETALKHCERLGVTVGQRASHSHFPLKADRLVYYESFTSKDCRVETEEERLFRQRDRNLERKKQRLKREQEQALVQ